MLSDLDATLKALLRDRGGLEADEIDIAFEAPDREWSARVGKPTVNCYLYDIRENLQLRETDWVVERQENGRVVTKRQPPRRFDLSYVCTAWTSDIDDEHRLLWRVLTTLIRYPILPRELLYGELAHSGYPIGTQVAQPDALLRNPAEVWSALDNTIRASVNFVATLAVEDMEPIASPLVLTKTLRFRQIDGEPWDVAQIAGHVCDATGAARANAVVRVQDHAFATVTSPRGMFWLAGLVPGTYTLVAEADGVYATRTIQVPGSDYDLVLGSDAEASNGEGTSAPGGGKPRKHR